MVSYMKVNCPICGRKMQNVLNTPLCVVCDWDVIYDLNGFVKYDL